MPSVPYIRFAQGTRDFLLGKLTALLPGMNADLAAQVDGGFAPFGLVAASVPNVQQPRIALSLVSDTAVRLGQNEKRVTITYQIEALIPVAGNNTASNFETARQVSHDWVQTLLDDDAQMLTPKIDAGLIGVVRASRAERGDFISLLPQVMADRVTMVRGWKVPYSASFSILTR